MNSVFKKLIAVGLILWASIYLTFIVDVYTLNTGMKRLFVLAYFVLAGGAVVFLSRRLLARALRGTVILAAVVAAICMLAAWQGDFLPTKQDFSVTFVADGADARSASAEVWLVEVYVDGEAVSLGDLRQAENQNWQYQAEYDDYVFIPTEDTGANELTFDFVAQEVFFSFAQNAWSGQVAIADSCGNSRYLNLYAAEAARDSLVFDNTRSYGLGELVLYNGGALIVLVFFCMLLLELVLSIGVFKKLLSDKVPAGGFSEVISADKEPDRLRPGHNTAADIVRIVAVFCVVSVHFFLNIGYYNQPVQGGRMLLMTFMRDAFMICVPLFLVLTGYLMSQKQLSLKYYAGIVKTLVVYVLASLLCIVYKQGYLGYSYSVLDIIKGLLDFTADNYAWYVEMYIGLFLIIPFLNLIYNNLQTKRQKQALLATVLCLAALPDTVSSWFGHSLIPDWWLGIWPLCYYFIGAYFREYPQKDHKILSVGLFVLVVAAVSAIDFFKSRQGVFAGSDSWVELPFVITTCLAFNLLINIKTDNWQKGSRLFVARIADLCLGIYLLSMISDNYLYGKLNATIVDIPARLDYYIIIVLLSFLGALGLSFMVNKLYELGASWRALQSRAGQPQQWSLGRKLLLGAACFVVVSAICCQTAYCHYDFFRQQTASQLTVINEGRDEDGLGSEVWLSINDNGRYLSVEELLAECEQNGGWFVKDNCLVSCSDGDWLTLPCQIPNNWRLEFMSHAYTGKVALNWQDSVEHYNFYVTGKPVEKLAAPWQGVNIDYSPANIMFFVAFGLAACVLLFVLLNRIRYWAWAVLFILCWLSILANGWQQAALTPTFLVILGLMLFSVCRLRQHWPQYLEKYAKGGALTAVLLLNLYFTFALIGNGLFMLGSRMTLNMGTISYFVLFYGAMLPLSYLLICLYEAVMYKAADLQPVTDKKKIRRVGLVCFAIILGIELFFSIGFYPATMSEDGATHWQQALGRIELTDNNPVIYALFIRLLSQIVCSPYIYIVFQLVFFAFVIRKIMIFLYAKGVLAKYLLLASCLIAFLPDNFLTLMLMSKNPMFAIINLWVLILLIEFMDNIDTCIKNKKWFAQIIIAITSLYFIRLNTFPGYYFIVFLFVFLSVRYLKTIKLKLLLSVGISLSLIWAITNPLYSQYEITKIKPGTFLTLFTPTASVYTNKLDLPDDIRELSDKILPKETWEKNYIPYHSDALAYGNPAPNLSAVSTKTGLKYYMDLLSVYPDIVIKDRLDGTELLWNIFQSKGYGAYNERYYLGIKNWLPQDLLPRHLQDIEANSRGMYFVPNNISNVMTSLADFTAKVHLLDIFIWRNGIYVVMALAMLVVLGVRRRWGIFCTILPTFIIWGTLMLVIGWQIYQYNWFFPLAAVAFVACACICGRQNRSGEILKIEVENEAIDNNSGV